MGSARKTIAVVPLSDTMADTARRDATLLAPAALGDRASDDEPFFDIDPNRQPDLWERAGEAYLHRLMGPFVGHLRAALRAETNAVLTNNLFLRDYKPISKLHLKVTTVERAKFPVIDVHSHLNDAGMVLRTSGSRIQQI